MVRTALYEAANVMLTRAGKFSTLKRWALEVAKRRGMRRARVALARKLACACWTTWQTSERLSGAWRPGLDAEHHPHRVVTDLDALDQGADDVAPGGPVRAIQPVADHVREQAQLADAEPERVRLPRGLLQRGRLGLEPGDPTTQLHEPWLELRLADQALGVTVDQPVDAATELVDPAFDGIELETAGTGLRGGQPSLVLLQDTRRVRQEPADLVPDGRIERLDRDQPGVAAELAMEPAAIGAAAPVIAPPPPVMVAREAVAALPADEQAP